MTRAERHFEELKDTSLPLPIWYQDGFNKKIEIWEINLTEKGICLYFPRWIQQNFPQKILPIEAPGIQNGDETTKTPGGRNSNMGRDGGP